MNSAKAYIALPAAALLSLSIMLTSCGNRQARETRDELDAAALVGRTLALQLAAGADSDSIAVERTLIEVKVREGALRREGADKVAYAYIDAFLTTLDSVNPSLHRILTAPIPSAGNTSATSVIAK